MNDWFIWAIFSAPWAIWVLGVYREDKQPWGACIRAAAITMAIFMLWHAGCDTTGPQPADNQPDCEHYPGPFGC